MFTDVVSGKRSDRPGLAELIDHARPGDRPCVTRLDRPGRSPRETVDDLEAPGIHLVGLQMRLDLSCATAERREGVSVPFTQFWIQAFR